MRTTYKAILYVALALSTTTSAICFGFFFWSMLAPQNEWFDWGLAYLVYGVIALGVCGLIDWCFNKFSVFVLKELMAFFSPDFQRFGFLRATNMILAFGAAIGFFLASFFSSNDGADIVAQVAKRSDISANYNPANFMSNISEQREANLKSYKNDITDVEKQKQATIKNSLTAYQYKEYKKGTITEEAKPKLEKIDKEFDKELKAKKDALQNASNNFDQQQIATSALATQDLQDRKKDNQTSFETIRNVLKLVGVYPLFIALAVIGMMAIDDMVRAIAKLPKPQPTPTNGGNNRRPTPPTKEEEDFERSF